jgi:hypothetical protein
VKLLCERGADIPLVDFIPVFHRWIQNASVPGRLIDVADYSHVPEGPGVILVSHEGIYSVDESDGARGLAYIGRRPPGDDTERRLSWVLSSALAACGQLEKDFGGRLRFRVDAIEIFANDRLRAPNEKGTIEALRPQLEAVAKRLYGANGWKLHHKEDERERFSVRLEAPAATAFSEVAARFLA